jgi:ribosomal protein S18 acetylase RimI-like enzyme
MNIRAVLIDEANALAAIAARTFYDTFSAQNKESDIRAYISEKCSVEQMELELKEPCSAFYFLEIDNQIVGYLKLNWGNAQNEYRTLNSLEIERIYILNTHHGVGYGKALLDFAIAYARSHAFDFVWLGVWEHNTRAIAFYERNGFTVVGKHTFLLGEDLQVDILMRFGIAR